jgi:hypothetical protein
MGEEVGEIVPEERDQKNIRRVSNIYETSLQDLPSQCPMTFHAIAE